MVEPYGRARVRVSGKADRAEGFLRLRDTDTSLITFREKQLSLAQDNSVTDEKVQILETRGKDTLQDNPILQARILTVEGSSSTLGVNYTFGEVRPSLGRRRGPRISTLKDDIIIMPGPSPPGSRPRQINSGVGPANGRPGQAPTDQVFFSSQLCLCPC
jgi:hypothetical protein